MKTGSSKSSLTGYLCSDTVFNLKKIILTEVEIKVLEKGLDYSQTIYNQINDPELQHDFEEFSRNLHLKRYLRNEPTLDFSQTFLLSLSLLGKFLKEKPSLELLLNQIEKEILEIPKTRLGCSNFTLEELKCMRSLADNRSIAIKKVYRVQVFLYGMAKIILQR